MAYQSLYRTWRPQTFSQMVGQEAILRALSNQAAQGRVAHAYLFCGSRGTGKTSAARIMAMAINCKQSVKGDPCLVCDSCKALMSETTLDVFEMDAASNSRVEEIREMLARTDYPPQFVQYKVYIIDEVHMLSNAAFNALLKTLEEPPEYMVFILATTEPQKLPATILSRCQRFDFGRIKEQEMIRQLKLALTDGIRADEGALQLIAATAQGSMRDAWSLMDMCLGIDQDLTEEKVRYALGAVSQDFLYEFLDVLIKGDTGSALQLTDQFMRSGRDVQVSLRELNAHVRQVLAFKWTGKGITDITQDQASQLKKQAQAASADLLLFILEKCMQAEQDARWSNSPRAILELFVLRSTQLQQEKDPSTIITRLGELEHRMNHLAAMPPDVSLPPPQVEVHPPVPQDEPVKEEPVEPVHNAGELVEPVHEAAAPAVPDEPAPAEAPASLLPLHEEQEIVQTKIDQPLANTPKDAWNNMLKRLSREHEGLYSMVYRGKYGGFMDDVFTLKLEKEDDILSSLLNDEARNAPISRILSEEMGKKVRFVAGELRPAVTKPQHDEQDENLEALSQVFGRDKIVVKKDL